MKVLVTNDELCIGCHLCEDVCSQAWYKDMDANKSSIRITSLGNAEWGMAVCNQCGQCIEVCPTSALYRDKQGIVRLRKKDCVGCLSCVSFCDIWAMRTHPDQTEPFKCVACGTCVDACPEGALSIQEVEDVAASQTSRWAERMAT